MKIIDIPQGSDQWHEERHGCVTGTKIESAIGACFSVAKQQWEMGGKTWEFSGTELVCVKDGNQTKKSKDKQKTLLLELVSDRQSELEINDFCSADMERGNLLEPLSLKAASIKHSVLLEDCGMLQSDTMPRFKFSPDGVCLDKNGAVIGGYETKSKQGKHHIEYMIDNVVPHEHLLQCLCPMIMDDCVKWWLFGHFDDRNKINDLFTVGIKRADYEEFIKVAREVLKDFIADVELTVKKMGGEYNG